MVLGSLSEAAAKLAGAGGEVIDALHAVGETAGHVAERGLVAIQNAARQHGEGAPSHAAAASRAGACDPAANVDVQLGSTGYEDAPPELRARLWMALAQLTRDNDPLALETCAAPADDTRRLWELISAQEVPPHIDHLASFELIDEFEDAGSAKDDDDDSEELTPLSSASSGTAGPPCVAPPPPHFHAFDAAAATPRPPPPYADALAVAAHLSPDLVETVTRDLHRTFPEHPLLRAKHGQAALLRVLTAYSAYDAEVGYCQGMGFLAGMLLTRVTEPDAYFLLCRYMHGARGLYGRSMADVAPLLDMLEAVGERRQPEFMRRLDDLGISPALYASSWLLTCFSCSMPLSFAERVMDMCLLSRQPLLVLLRVALAVLAECALLYDLGSADAPTPPASAEGEGAAATEDAFARAARSHRTGGTVDAFESAVKALKDSPALWETHRTRAVLAAAVRDDLGWEEVEQVTRSHVEMKRERADAAVVRSIVEEAVAFAIAAEEDGMVL